MAKKIADFLDEQGNPKKNITDLIDKEELKKLGLDVVSTTERDLNTMDEWLEKANKAMDIAKQVMEAKTWPWDGAANVKYPLITGASIQFAARAYAEIIKGHEVVKGQVMGKDEDGSKSLRAKRISRHMSYQLLDQMTEWEPQTDQMLHMLPVLGTCFKKSYYCPLKERNVSELVKAGPGGLILNNKTTKDLETARRLTHEFPLYANDIKERISGGVYDQDIEIDKLIPADADGDDQPPHDMLEQHRWIDLDKDGYQEPYIVTVHKNTATVVRVVPSYDADTVMMNEQGGVVRIIPLSFFTKVGFFPDPDGGFLDLGFGHILYPINEAINTTLNQLLDAGTLANTQGGFVSRGFRLKATTFSIKPGEWKQIDVGQNDLKNSLLPLPTKEPSNVLFMLLGFLVEAGKGLANQTEVLQGETTPNTTATTTLALIEQGLKVYNSIYKRVYRAMKEEFRKLARLNRIYLNPEEYFNVLDDTLAIAQLDYEDKDIAVLPVADPAASTEVQRMARAQALMQIRQDPLANGKYILDRYVDAIGEDPAKALLQEQPQQPPDPKVLELELKKVIETSKIEIEAMLAQSQIELNNTIGIKNIADAEAKEIGQQFDQYMQQVQHIHQVVMDMQTLMQQRTEKGEGGLPSPPEPLEPAGPKSGSSMPEVTDPLAGITGRVFDPESDGRLNAGKIEARAAGGPVEAGQPYLVGEEGPEIIVPDNSGTVVPNYGLRPNGTRKGNGYFGPLPMTDGSGRVATELTTHVEFDGRDMDLPVIVPTLNDDEKAHLLSGKKPTRQIIDKAIRHAIERENQGLNPYFD